MPNLTDSIFRIIEISVDAFADLIRFVALTAFCSAVIVGAALLVGGA
jgi:hypothetical protein